MFLTPKTNGQILLVKILGFLKSAKIFGLPWIKIPGLTPVEILGYFLTTRFLTPKTHCLCGLSKLGAFKEYKDIGPTSYPNPSFNTCQNLGLFHTNLVSWCQKNPWPTFACQNLGIFKECKDFGPTLYQSSRINTCRNLGVFLKNQAFDTKNTLSVWLVEMLVFF